MALKVLHLSTYDANGGAARAAYSLHRALLAQGVTSRMRVGIKNTDDPTVAQGRRRKFTISSLLDRQLWRVQRSPRTTWRSPARFSSVSATEINASGADIVNLHWVTDGFMSVEEIGKIEIPIVWSMYDMWPFSGTEHYGNPEDGRWSGGYTKGNRPADESGFDLDRWTFDRKVRNWSTRTQSFHMVPASSWLEDATRESALMTGWPITRIPHVIDTEVFSPIDRAVARTQLNIPPDAPVVLFLASAGISDKRKGWDLLAPALHQVSQEFPDLRVVIAGPIPGQEAKQAVVKECNAVIHWQETITSDQKLKHLYAAADLVAVPSRQDNMPLTAMEALASGTPIVGFRVGGLIDIVTSPHLGHLAEPEDIDNLACGIVQVLASRDQEQIHKHAKQQWSPEVVAGQYLSIYAQERGISQ